jgi:hypothetical protein
MFFASPVKWLCMDKFQPIMSRLNGLDQFLLKVKLFRKENLCEDERLV